MKIMNNSDLTRKFVFRKIKQALIVSCCHLYLFPIQAHSIALGQDADDFSVMLKKESESELDSLGTSGWQELYLVTETGVKNQARAIARQGLELIKNKQVEEGLKKLYTAWEIDKSEDAIGLLITLTQIDNKNLDAALEAAKKLQANSPKHEQGFVLEGIVQSLKGNSAEAQASYRKAIEINPGSPSANGNLAVFYVLNREYEEARQLYQAVLKQDPKQVKTLLKLAELEKLTGHSDLSKQYIDRAIEIEPEGLEPRLMLAHQLLSSGKPKEAINAVEPIKSKYLDSAALLEVEGIAQSALGNKQAALAAFDHWATLKPGDVMAHYHLSNALEQLGQIKPALDEIEVALKLDPANVLSKFAKARLTLLAGDIPSSEKLLADLQNIAGKDNASYVAELQGMLSLAKGRPDQAIPFFKAALDQRETNFLNIKLALSYIQASQDDKGFTQLTDWLRKYPSDNLTTIALADVYLAKGQRDKAEKYYLDSLELQSENPYVLNNVAWLMAERGALGKAQTYAERSYHGAKSPSIVDTLAVIYLKQGKTDDAVVLLRKEIETYPDSPDLKFLLAKALLKQGSKEEAKELLTNLIVMKKPFKNKDQAEKILKEL